MYRYLDTIHVCKVYMCTFIHIDDRYDEIAYGYVNADTTLQSVNVLMRMPHGHEWAAR